MGIADTWEFDGVDWQQLAPVLAPLARHGHGMCFDPGRARVVLFVGTGSFSQFRDTWEWNGTNWIPVALAVQPPAYGTATMADDARIG